MTIQTSTDRVPCEQPIMMWNHVTDLHARCSSEHPSKKQIEQFVIEADLYDPRLLVPLLSIVMA